jgi:hypothetical protein
MKTFRQYLAEAVKEIPMRIKIAGEVSDQITDTIEAELQRYDVVDISKPQKTIMQEHPLDFGTKIRNAEVFIIDAVVRMPFSAEILRRNLSDKIGIPYDYIVVKSENDPLEAENQAEYDRQQSDPADYEPKIGQDYTEEESKVEGDETFGEKHKENFLKTLADNKDKDPDRAQVEVEGPLSVKSKEKTADTSQPKESESAKSPLTKDNR